MAEVLMEEKMNMHKTKSISDAEYHMIRQEIDGNIKKQDEIGNIIFAVLGLSFVFNNWVENVLFLISMLLISAVLLSKIIHCRNSVYYLSSYLMTDEAVGYCEWEKKITLFKSKAYSNRKNNGFIRFVFHCAFIMRNLGNLILCCFLFVQIVNQIQLTAGSFSIKYSLLAIAFLSLVLNLVFTIVICTDRKIKERYKQIWIEVLKGREE